MEFVADCKFHSHKISAALTTLPSVARYALGVMWAFVLRDLSTYCSLTFVFHCVGRSKDFMLDKAQVY